MSLVLALDFDNSLVQPVAPLRWKAGAKEAIGAFKTAGQRLILFSCRNNPMDESPDEDLEAAEFYRTGAVPGHLGAQWRRFAEMRAFLKAEGVWDFFDEVWQSPGKPTADVFVDDKMEAPNWMALMREFGIPLTHV